MKYSLALFTLLCTVFTALYAQPGTLDKTFGDGGIMVSPTYGACNDLLIQKDGKILSVGSGYFNNKGGYMVIRYNQDGTPDLSFGDSGRVVTPITEDDFGAYGALQEDGKIVVAGYVEQQGDGNNLAVVRYTANGILDSSFGINGVVVDAIAKHYETPTGIAIQPDGKIVIGGYTADFSDDNPEPDATYLVRYNEDGSHDLSFGNGGVNKEYSSDPLQTGGVALQSDGKLLIGGNYTVSNSLAFFTKRLMPDGTPDKTFGSNGLATHYFRQGSGESQTYATLVQDNGKIIVAGSTYHDINGLADRYATMVQFNADGSTDDSFGTGGEAINAIGKYGSIIYDLALQPDGRIVAAVNSLDLNTGKEEFAVARYLPEGVLDSSFGVNGSNTMVINDQPTSVAVALQQDGKIVLGGYSVTYNPYFYHVTLARYNGDKEKQPLAIRIKRWLQHHGISWNSVQANNIRYYAVQKSSDGITYKEVARVSNRANTYEDAATPATDSYYRIAAVSWDGTRTYSNMVLVDDAQKTLIYPNPVRSNLQLQGLPSTGTTNLSIVDLNGNVRSTTTATGTSYSVSTANLSSGSYLLKIQHGNTIATQPFVKE